MGPLLEQNGLYRVVHQLLDRFLPDSLAWLAYAITAAVLVLAVGNAVLIAATVFTWVERRLLGRFQHRIGPNRWGPFGLLQPIADAVKLLFKEDVVPAAADRLVFNLAPVVLFAPVLAAVAVIPFGAATYLSDLNVAVLFVIALGSVETLGFFMAGWGSGNRYALFGAMRAVAALVSYEVPLVLSLVGVLMLAGSMSLVGVVEAQRLPAPGLPFLLLQPLGFFVFLVAAMAEMNRPPFDLMEAESELVAGYYTEYGGMKFGVLFLAEVVSPVVASGFITALFLGGWAGWSFLPSQVWFLLKWMVVLFLLVWVRATIPRLRIDQVLNFAWKFLFPLSLLNILATGVEVVLLPEPSLGQLWLLAGVNLAVAVGAMGALANLQGHRRHQAAPPLRPPALSGTEVR